MATQVVLPQLGESVVEGKVSRWLKQAGDEIKQYEPILEVETDKVTVEITAATSGVLLAILVEAGRTVKVGAPLAIIGQPGETVEAEAVPVGVVSAPGVEREAEGFAPHTALRRAIAEHMVRSKRTSPHASTLFEADLSRIVAHREANKTAFEREGVRLTLTAYFVAAAAAALQAHPTVNSTFTDEGLILHKRINIGVAVSLGAEGLIVPVIKDAAQLRLPDIARRISELADQARRKLLTPDDVAGATFTLTNHGIGGSLFAIPIINQPNVAILGVGALHKRPVVITPHGVDTLAIRPMVYMGLTFDHRVLDGASADAFMATLKEALENWQW